VKAIPLTPRTSQDDRPEATAERAIEKRLIRRPPRKKSDWERVSRFVKRPMITGRKRVTMKMVIATGWVSFS
jgi:hypothetical protein